MIKYGRLIRDIIPDDQLDRKDPSFYSKDSKIEITPLGIYVDSGRLKGWLYKNTQTQEIYKLEEGIDYTINKY